MTTHRIRFCNSSAPDDYSNSVQQCCSEAGIAVFGDWRKSRKLTETLTKIVKGCKNTVTRLIHDGGSLDHVGHNIL